MTHAILSRNHTIIYYYFPSSQILTTSEAFIYHINSTTRTENFSDFQVTWLRRTADKVHLLTVGLTTYSGDSRVAVKFQYPNNWKLSINPVQKEDAGLYMCQVSTHPPRVLLTNMTVLGMVFNTCFE